MALSFTCRPLSWMKDKGMGAFLAVAKGSEEIPWLLEVQYNGGPPDMKPLALVGKGMLCVYIIYPVNMLMP